MASIGCDYSAAEGYFAVTDEESVLETVKVKLKGDLAEQRRDYLFEMSVAIKALYDKHGCEPILWLEQPWISGSRFPHTAIKLARNNAYIEVAALAAGLDVRFVHISTWRKAVYGNGKPQDTKGTALSWVLMNLGFETKNHNFAEAACIAYYGGKYA